MKIINFFIYFFILILFSNSRIHSSIPSQCYDFVEQYKNLKFDSLSYQIPLDNFEDFGFSFNLDPSEDEVSLSSIDLTSKIRRTNNYPVISTIWTYKSYDLFKEGDILISIDGSDLSKMSDQEIFNIAYTPETNKESQIILLRDNKKIKLKIIPQEYQIAYYGIDFGVESIKEIDVINSSVTFSAYISSDLSFTESTFPKIIDLAKKHIFQLKEDGSNYLKTDCIGLDYNYSKENRIPNPIEIISFDNLIEENKNLLEERVDINAFKDDDELLLKFSGNSSGTWEVKNEFNLSSFPFDKQKIKISIIGEDIEESVIEFNDTSFRLIDYSKDKISIPGWDLKEIKLHNSNFTMRDVIFSKLDYEIYIERQYFYYIFKIILPIMLILSICWSSVWLDRKEVESKLTITIVCLLSLIAYNFVIDNEIPKLNYLTIMDWIILLSYFYAAAPNILAIISYQLGLNSKYRVLNSKINKYSKNYGILSYVMFVLLIIIISVSNVPENTIDALSWAMVR